MKCKRNSTSLNNLKSKSFGVAILAQAIAMHSAQAETSDEQMDRSHRTQIEELVVTATKRATSQQDTPLAISAVKGDQLAQTQTFDVESLSRMDPSVQINNRGIGDNQIIVRGISSAGKPTVGLYYDEAVITGLGLDGGSDNQPNLGMHDVQRVEILKGPQGTLFGASSMSGTLRIVTNDANLSDVEGSVSFSAAGVSDGNPFYRGEAVVNLPIVTDKLAVRGVVWGDFGGGYIDKVSESGDVDENVNDQTVSGGKLLVGAQPTENLVVKASVIHQESEAEDSQYYEYSEGAYNNISPTLENFEDEIDLFSVVADYSTDFGTFTATGSYLDRDMYLSRDSTPTAVFFGIPAWLAYHQDQQFSMFSSEFRFSSDFAGPVQLVSGVFFGGQEMDARNAALVADQESGEAACDFHADCVESGFAMDDINSGLSSSTVDQFAAFAETTIDITDRLSSVIGVRYYEADIDEKRVSTQGLRFPSSPVQTDDVIQLEEQITEDEVSYNLALSYVLSESTTLYARAASGFRPGGVNNADTAAQYGITVPGQYDSDELWNYEVGAKSYLGQHLYGELTFYHIDWSRQQISATDPEGTFVYIANAGESTVDGVEAMLNADFSNGWTGNIGITYTDSKLAEDLPDSAETTGYSGDRLPYTARVAFSGQVQYEFELPKFGSNGFISTNFNYRGNSYTAFNEDDSNYQELHSYHLVSARAGIRRDTWELGMFIDNLTDEIPEIGLRVTGDGYRVYTTRPRTIGVNYKVWF
ncbi:TonB-dependent receptor [Teredinibacter turnerae]|uniref:TonB-dependent receptor n=1 Tax=Teredinibacter turnerae TaxID=2426 RepID=UPI0030CD3EB8